jgi:hypothetical protein
MLSAGTVPRQAGGSAGMTELSDYVVEMPVRSRSCGLARTSHHLRLVTFGLASALLAFCTGGCLVSDPPQNEERTQTAPVLDALGAVPPPTQILNLTSGETRAFSVDVRSEDDGEDLWAMLHLNYGIASRTLQTGGVLAPSTFDHVRTIQLSWRVPDTTTVPGITGCNQITLVVAHESDVNPFTGILISDEGAASITWWANINDSDDTLDDCPSISDLDAGAGS